MANRLEELVRQVYPVPTDSPYILYQVQLTS